jgi:septation ring formation regulator EzrA
MQASVAYSSRCFVLQDVMVDSPENLVLSQLRAIRADISDVQGSLGDIKRRLANLENGQASIIQHLGNLAAADAQQQLATDGLGERLVRIERRLELRDS